MKVDCCIFTVLIAAWIPDRPWYLRDENAEIEMLKRHKSFLSEFKTYSGSILPWLRNIEFEDLESERDAWLCVSRNPRQLGTCGRCDGCNRKIKGIEYLCLECKDLALCGKCHQQRTEPLGHASFHKMAELR